MRLLGALYRRWLGRPSGPPRQGPRWIITAELKEFLEANNAKGMALANELPFGVNPLKRLRKILGLTRAAIWESRVAALETLTVREAAEKFQCASQTINNWRKTLGLAGSRQRPDGWYREPRNAELLTSGDLPLSWLASYFAISLSTVHQLRHLLRNAGYVVTYRRGGFMGIQ